MSQRETFFYFIKKIVCFLLLLHFYKNCFHQKAALLHKNFDKFATYSCHRSYVPEQPMQSLYCDCVEKI